MSSLKFRFIASTNRKSTVCKIIGLALLATTSAAGAVHDVPLDFPTIQGAIDGAASDDTIQVAPGTYPERLTIFGKHLTILGVGGAASTLISGTNFPPDGQALLTIDANGPCLFSGLTFQDAGDSTCLGGAVSNVTTSGVTIEFDNCFFLRNLADEGGAIHSKASSLVIRNCLFEENTGLATGGGVYVEFGDVTIDSSSFKSNFSPGTSGIVGSGAAVHMWSADGSAITESLFSGNAGEWSVVDVAIDGVTVSSNTFVGNSGSSLLASSVYFGQVIADRNIFFEGTSGWAVEVSNSTVSLSCNDFWGGVGDTTSTNGGAILASGNFNLDPLFCDAEGGDYHLTSGSPCFTDIPNGCEQTGAFGPCSTTVATPLLPSASLDPQLFFSRLANGRVRLNLEGVPPSRDAALLTVYDVLGRSVFRTDLPSEDRVFTWMGGSDVGAQLSNGIYYVRWQVGRTVATASIILYR